MRRLHDQYLDFLREEIYLIGLIEMMKLDGDDQEDIEVANDILKAIRHERMVIEKRMGFYLCS